MATVTHRGPLEAAAGGASAEVIGGIAAVVLSILGLANVAPQLMLSIASIVIGAAFILEGAIVGAEYGRLISSVETVTQQPELSSGLTVQLLAGITGVVLGILALLGLDPQVLMSAAAIVFGSALVFSSGSMARLNELKAQQTGAELTAQMVVKGAASAASGAQIFTGLGSVILGILALSGIQPMTLTLVALLAVATAVLLSGTAVGGKVFSLLKWE